MNAPGIHIESAQERNMALDGAQPKQEPEEGEEELTEGGRGELRGGRRGTEAAAGGHERWGGRSAGELN